MKLIQKITSNPLQRQALVLDDGSILNITMYFRPLQVGWFFNEIVWNDFTLQGLRITNQPNMLYQWRNILPFGLGCFSAANREPTQQNDFLSGASSLYVLTAAEVVEYTRFLEGG